MNIVRIGDICSAMAITSNLLSGRVPINVDNLIDATSAGILEDTTNIFLERLDPTRAFGLFSTELFVVFVEVGGYLAAVEKTGGTGWSALIRIFSPDSWGRGLVLGIKWGLVDREVQWAEEYMTSPTAKASCTLGSDYRGGTRGQRGGLSYTWWYGSVGRSRRGGKVAG